MLSDFEISQNSLARNLTKFEQRTGPVPNLHQNPNHGPDQVKVRAIMDTRKLTRKSWTKKLDFDPTIRLENFRSRVF